MRRQSSDQQLLATLYILLQTYADGTTLKQISRILSAIMHLDEARSQFLTKSQSQRKPFFELFVQEISKDWTRQLIRVESSELIANGLKTLRLLTENQTSLHKVVERQPNLLTSLKFRILENESNRHVSKEARGLIFNIRQADSSLIDESLEALT